MQTPADPPTDGPLRALPVITLHYRYLAFGITDLAYYG